MKLATEHTVGVRGDRVTLRVSGVDFEYVLELSWKAADEFAFRIRLGLQEEASWERLGLLQTLRLELGGKSVLFPHPLADALRMGLTEVARRVEEVEQAERIILDQALLTRTGAPIGLSNHPKIKEEAAKEASWNRDLRRYLPGGVKSKAVLGTPTIIVHPPKVTP